ncbi:MAG: hypothetical protein ACLQUR_03490, partial [Limisphaerales bacterium]
MITLFVPVYPATATQLLESPTARDLGSQRPTDVILRPRQNQIATRQRVVVSRFLCKRFERVLIPVNVHTVKDAIKDAFTTAAGGEGTHR